MNLSKEQLKKKLTPEQYRVTQENGTQDPYTNKYYKCKKEGVYACIVCDVPLFTSDHKYDSGSGWPAFWDEIQGANIKKIQDHRFGIVKTEARCGNCDSHLGHIFKNGPKEKTGVRYCINSVCMNLIRKQ